MATSSNGPGKPTEIINGAHIVSYGPEAGTVYLANGPSRSGTWKNELQSQMNSQLNQGYSNRLLARTTTVFHVILGILTFCHLFLY